MVKKQQMRWSPRGAHLLLQIRTRVLNDTLADDYRRWYPGLPTPTGRTRPHSLPRFVPLSDVHGFTRPALAHRFGDSHAQCACLRRPLKDPDIGRWLPEIAGWMALTSEERG